MNYYIEALQRFADFNGRIRRKAYWMFFLFNLIFSIVATVIDMVLGTAFIGTIYSLVLLIPSLAAGARRLHDTGRSGWWQLLYFLPLIGFIVLIIFFAQDSQDGDNDHGPNPKEADLEGAVA
ncbi:MULTISPECIES: DUF805 domain-containing protein [unclassified Pseudoalteromonas]|uniref:DUF805 domain-containing protein n=1 Tax=unclassified Pseudoalteromonas TaxID=194690 RepID=UPI000CF64B13|nr:MULTISPECIES: DUF805 domain-containing protein [unclassified Pseudoalteromonas]MBS3796840.1 DUF805 domain-containing protein [Pseudoalteromonas sp. BDTF-M6]